MEVDGIPFYWGNEVWSLSPYYRQTGEDFVSGFHVSNILNKLGKKKDVSPSDVKNLIKTKNDYCLSCGNILEFKADKPSVCGETNCLYAIEEILIGDYVTSLIKEEPEVCAFHLYAASSALYSNRVSQIWDPSPIHFQKAVEVKPTRGKMLAKSNQSVLEVNDVDKIKTFLHNWTLVEIKKKIIDWKKFSTDTELMASIGEPTYRLVRFILMSPKTKLKVSTTKTKDSHSVFYQTVHDPLVEQKWTETDLLFHGSGADNWYSILRNGLQSMSKTPLQLNGAAYGDGIYLSNNFEVSSGYSANNVYNSYKMIGVFQTKNLISTYKTNYPEYFVVKDTSDLFLRGIVVTNVCVLEGDALFDFNTLQNYLKERKSSAMETKPTTDQLPVKGSSNKRLMKEYQQLVADKTIPFKFELVEDNLYQWKIIIPRSSFEDEKNSLVVDMDKYKVDHIEMEIRFDTKYPFLPPFLRVVRPRFQPQTSHITSGGSICVDILVQGIWKPTCSIESLILQIKLLILEGDGRLDGVNLNKPYTISDAEDSFVRVAKSHGWM